MKVHEQRSTNKGPRTKVHKAKVHEQIQMAGKEIQSKGPRANSDGRERNPMGFSQYHLIRQKDSGALIFSSVRTLNRWKRIQTAVLNVVGDGSGT